VVVVDFIFILVRIELDADAVSNAVVSRGASYSTQRGRTRIADHKNDAIRGLYPTRIRDAKLKVRACNKITFPIVNVLA
jgi:hypothetical protein